MIFAYPILISITEKNPDQSKWHLVNILKLKKKLFLNLTGVFDKYFIRQCLIDMIQIFLDYSERPS